MARTACGSFTVFTGAASFVKVIRVLLAREQGQWKVERLAVQ
jgi:hypothetical protein